MLFCLIVKLVYQPGVLNFCFYELASSV